MKFEKLNKQLITFCAVGLLFAGSLYYFVSVAFQNKDVLLKREAARTNLDDYFGEPPATTTEN